MKIDYILAEIFTNIFRSVVEFCTKSLIDTVYFCSACINILSPRYGCAHLVHGLLLRKYTNVTHQMFPHNGFRIHLFIDFSVYVLNLFHEHGDFFKDDRPDMHLVSLPATLFGRFHGSLEEFMIKAGPFDPLQALPPRPPRRKGLSAVYEILFPYIPLQ